MSLRRRSARVAVAGLALVAAGCSDSLLPQGGGGAPAMEVPVEEVPTVAWSPIPRRSIVMLQDGDEPVADVARALLAEHAPKAGARADSVVPLAASRGFVVTLTEREAATMAADPRVAYAENDKPTQLDQSAPWALDRVNQRALPLDASGAASGDGTGVQVYILDTGVLANHVDFGGRVTAGPDFVSGSGTSSGDCHGHGTLVASDAAGATMGLATGASIFAVRTMGCDGTGSTVSMIQGLDWVTARKVASPSTPMVVNMSNGVPSGFSPLDDAVARATQAGVIVVVSAGNSNTNACNQSPARAPSAITVGATDRTDARASFSNYGTCVDVWAPGALVEGAAASNPSGFATWSGTSASAPYVSGVAALYLQQYPDAAPAQLSQALAATATPNVVRGTGVSNNRLVYSGLTLPNATTPTTTGGTGGGSTEPTAPGPPTAAASITCVRRACTFDGRGSTDATGVTRWSWAFGDGGKATSATASRTYKSNGKFAVALTVSNAAGMSATRVDTVTIADGAPTAAFSATCSGWTCTLDASGSSDDGVIRRYSWSYGDGRSGSGSTPTMRKLYSGVATYQVRLVVTDDVGQVDTVTVPVKTEPRPPVPRATVSCTTARVCTFDASRSTDDVGVSNYTWNFLDNSLQTGAKVTKQYSAAGTYQFRLTVRSTSGLQTNLDGQIALR